MQVQSNLPTEKRCARCFETKPASAFYVVRNRDRPVQLSAQCRRCHNGGPAHPDYIPIITGRPKLPKWPSLIEQTCVVCGTTFEARRNALARGEGTTCSRSCANSLRKIPEPQRFATLLRSPDSNGCRHWRGAIGRNGYGRFSVDSGKQVEVHRYAFAQAHGPIPPGWSVCHRCDVYYPAGDITYRRCGEPLHLFLGTNQDNLEDRDAKRRQARGERTGMAKLTDADVRDVRRLRTTGLSQQKIAESVGVSQAVISGILLGKLWRHVL
jgi:hypothetical protein